MADSGYAEGDIADGPNGQVAVFTGGKWVIQGTPQMPLPQGDQEAVKALQDQANDADYLAQQARRFTAMQAGGNGQSPVQTGPMLKDIEIPHVAENINPLVPLAEMIDPRIKGLASISKQAWVHMRPQGSGSIRGYEAQDFKEAFPNIETWGRANNLMSGQLQQNAVDAANKLKFVDNFIRGGNGTFADANAAWEAQQNGQQPVGRYGRVMGPPMQMVPDPSSPIGASPAPGAPVPAIRTPQETAILNWTPDKGLH